MRPIRCILAAIKNPAERSQPAVAKAVQLAQALGAKLELFHALTTSIYIGPPDAGTNAATIEREEREACLRQLDRIATKLHKPKLTVSVAAEWDYPAHEAIVRCAMAIKADLIVAQRHGTKHRLAWLLAYTDWELLRLSAVPVLLVGTSRPYHHPTVLAAVDPTHTDKPPTLDSDILRAGATVTATLHGKLHALHVHVPFTSVVAETYVQPDAAVRIERQLMTDARTRFDRLLRATAIPRGSRHLVSGDPAAAIDTTAREVGAAIVVMGTISRSGLKRALIGNTAERAFDGLRCDVLVVKPRRFKAPVPRKRGGVRVITVPLSP